MIEKNAIDVNEKRCIFEFWGGSFHGGQVDYRIYQEEDGCRVLVRGFNGRGLDAGFLVPDKEIEPLKCIISGLKWEKRYECENRIFDGYEWYLKGWGIESSGYEAYPEDFEVIKCVIQKIFIHLCVEYDSLTREEIFGLKNIWQPSFLEKIKQRIIKAVKGKCKKS